VIRYFVTNQTTVYQRSHQPTASSTCDCVNLLFPHCFPLENGLSVTAGLLRENNIRAALESWWRPSWSEPRGRRRDTTTPHQRDTDVAVAETVVEVGGGAGFAGGGAHRFRWRDG